MNRFWIVLVIIVIGLFGLFFFLRKPSSAPTISIEDAKKVASDDYIRLNKGGKVVIIEYADFQCPGCAGSYPFVKQMEEKYQDQVTFVYRFLPLTSIHPNAYTSARVAVAAGVQGKFFEMHDKLFDTQQVWGQMTTNQQKLFEDYAQELGLNIEQFRKDYASEETANRINRDRDSSQYFKITATPAFVMNGELMKTNVSSAEAFENEIKNAIIKAYGSVQTSETTPQETVH